MRHLSNLPRTRRIEVAVSALAALLLSVGTAGAAATPGQITIELNKLVAQNQACGLYFVVDNPTDSDLQALNVEAIFFRGDGIIDRQLALEFAPVRRASRHVKVFELKDMACDQVGSILINDAIACRDAAGPIADCLGRLAVSTRSAVTLTK